MSRPAVDVVVPFAGSAAQLARVVARLERLAVGPADTLTVVDNRPAEHAGPVAGTGRVRIVASRERACSYLARNRGAALGRAPWILFLDADVDPAPDLLDAYLAEPPGERTGVLAGRVADEDVGDPFAAQVVAAATLAQHTTLDREHAYAQTASCMVRRCAFGAVGGFAEVVSGGDADLCFRLRDAGWAIERRDGASATHENRATLRALARQKLRHGAGAAWLDTRWPGAIPGRPAAGVARHAARGLVDAGRAALRGDVDGARAALAAPVADVAFTAGRRLGHRRR